MQEIKPDNFALNCENATSKTGLLVTVTSCASGDKYKPAFNSWGVRTTYIYIWKKKKKNIKKCTWLKFTFHQVKITLKLHRVNNSLDKRKREREKIYNKILFYTFPELIGHIQSLY